MVELTILTSCARLFGEKAFSRPKPWECLRMYRPKNEKPLLFYKA